MTSLFNSVEYSEQQDMIDQAAVNVVKIAKAHEDMMQVLEALAAYGNRMLHQWNTEKFFEGLRLMREAAYADYMRMTSDCFTLCGAGGDAAIEYSRERFNKIFNEEERYSIMRYLDTWGKTPKSWTVSAEEKFREDAKKRQGRKTTRRKT